MTALDQNHMRAAIAMARRAIGTTVENPPVGCVIVTGTRVIARAATAPGGRPHAETQALSIAGAAARGSVVYVTLEPCSHWGQTGPCAEALIKAGVARVVIAIEDPDPRVAGRGVAMLKEAGIEVLVGVGAVAARETLAGYLSRIEQGRPAVTLKLAQSADGRIALENGDSQWITNALSRRKVHQMRARHDAILTGIGTVLADDPRFTCRLSGLSDRNPVPVILDSKGRMPATVTLMDAQVHPTALVYSEEEKPELIPAHIDWIQQKDCQLLAPILADLGARGFNSVLVEAGGHIAASFIAEGLVDRLEIFTASKLLGADAKGVIAPLGLEALQDAPKFRLSDTMRLGDDLLASYVRQE